MADEREGGERRNGGRKAGERREKEEGERGGRKRREKEEGGRGIMVNHAKCTIRIDNGIDNPTCTCIYLEYTNAIDH